VTLAGTPTFSTAFAVAARCGTIDVAPASYSGAATGKRHEVIANGVIDSGGAAFPGDAAGTTASGGQFL
jgi:hypothetical protein